MTEALSQIVPINQSQNGIPTVNMRDVHKALGSKKDFSDWIKSRIEKYGFVEGKEFTVLLPQLVEQSRGGHNKIEYHGTLSMAKELAMVENTEKGKAVRTYFIEAEERYRNRSQVALPQSFAEALRQLADAVEKREEVERQLLITQSQRDRAIETKAEIGSKREATAMATASLAVRKAAQLEEKLGISEEWKSVKSIEWLKDFFDFTTSKALYSLIGKALKKKSEAMRFHVRQIPSSEYGHILTFHSQVIEAFKVDLCYDSTLMAKYRKVFIA